MNAIATPSAIGLYRMKVLRSAIGLEIKGMKRRGRSAYAIAKCEFGLRGNRASVYAALGRLIDISES